MYTFVIWLLRAVAIVFVASYIALVISILSGKVILSNDKCKARIAELEKALKQYQEGRLK